MTHRSMRRKALHMSAEFEPPVSLPVVLRGSMPSSSKQLIKTVHQNGWLNQLTNIGLHRFPYPLFCSPILSTLFHGGFYGEPDLPTSVWCKDP